MKGADGWSMSRGLQNSEGSWSLNKVIDNSGGGFMGTYSPKLSA